MLSPAIRPSRKGVTFANGTAKERPDGGTPIQSPPLVPWRVPHGHDFISEGITRVFGCEVGKRCEVPLLVSFADRRSSLAAQSESMRFEEAVPHECREDSVVVSGGLGVTMPLKEALHLLGTHARHGIPARIEAPQPPRTISTFPATSPTPADRRLRGPLGGRGRFGCA